MKKINLLLAILVFAFIFSCKTTKSRTEELTGIKKLYQNTTARYNGYFNADVILMNSVAAMEDAHQDNYNKILPVFKYTAGEPIQSVNNDLDIAIEKVSIVATLHRQSDWTDDCYLLLGKAQYLQQDYESAEETLEYTLKEFNPSALAQRAREAARKKGSGGKKKVQAKKSPAQKAKEQERDEREEEIKLTKKQQVKQRNKTNKALKKKRIKERKEKEKARKRRKKGKKPKKKTPPTEEKKEDVKPKEDPVNKIVKEPKEKEKKKAKEKEEFKPEKIFNTEKLAYDEIQLWLARTYIEREDYSLAERYLGNLGGGESKKVIREEIDAVTAHLYLKQKRYDSAIPYLEKAIEKSPDKNDKARYSFIRAQLAERNNNDALAAEYFTKAIKYSNNYELEFSARLSMLKSSFNSGSKTMASTTRELERMLKDEKNVEYQDQVYFTLAELNLESGDKTAAIENYRKSLNTQSNNKAQKTETYLKLAELYYEDEAYVDSKLFYDSTLQIIDKVDDRYDTVKTFSENLEEIAKNIQIIALQDSLINISNMSADEKRDLAIQLKKEKDALAANSKNASSIKPASKFGPNDGRRGSNLTGVSGRPAVNNRNQVSSQFPLYNEKIRKKGAKDFEKIWGGRVLEDNWRRANKQTIDGIDKPDIQEVAVEDRLNEDDINKILIAVPKDEGQLKAANKKIETAYFDLGRLFRDRLQRNDKSIEALEDELLVRYPETEHKLDTWYYLYLAHQKEGNKPQAKKYFDLIVGNFPNTTYARVLTDPNYLEAAKKEGDKLGQYYKVTYASFQEKNYEKVIKDVDSAQEQFGPGNIMMAKFALLKAMSIGNTKGKDDYILQLKEVIGKFPNSPEETRAREILRLLGDKSVAVQPKTGAAGTGKQGAFKVDPEALHYIAVLITNKNGQKVSEAKNSVADFNKTNFRNESLRMSNIYINNDVSRPVLIIRKFKNQAKAMAYYKAATDAGSDFLSDKMEYVIYPLTQANYREVLKSKGFDGYDEFFKDNYDN